MSTSTITATIITAKERTSNVLSGMTKSRVTKEGVLKDVHIIGLIGKSNKAFNVETPYTYKESTLKQAADLKVYESVDSFIGHSEGDAQRSPKDRIGLVKNTYFKESVGILGDIHFDVKHPHYESMVWWANNHPERLMLSHEAALVYSKADNAIVNIKKVHSVDFVLEGNTTESLFKEGVIDDEMSAEDIKQMLARIINTARDLMYDVMYPMNSYNDEQSNKALTDQEKAVKMLPVAQDLVRKLKSFNSTSESTHTAQENNMDYKDIKMDELAKARPDIIKAIESSALEAETKLSTRVLESVKAIPADKRSDTFMKQVKEATRNNDEATVKELVADRLTLVKEAVTSTPPASAQTGDEVASKEAASKSAAKELSDDDILATVNE